MRTPGFNQFAADKKPGPPTSVYLDDIQEDVYSPSVGVTWNQPDDCGDQPLEYCMLEGATIPCHLYHLVNAATSTMQNMDQLEWIAIADCLPLDSDYFQIHVENFNGFSTMVSTLELAALHSSAPPADMMFLFSVAYVSSVGIGTPQCTEVLNLDNTEGGEGEIEDGVQDESILPVIEMPMSRRKRKMKKGHVDMYQFKF